MLSFNLNFNHIDMSLGALKKGEDEYYDLSSSKSRSREWYGEQQHVELRPYAGHRFPEELQRQINKIIGDLLADIQEASFVSRKTLNTVHVPEGGYPVQFDDFPRSTTLPLHRLASTIYNRSGDVVRQFINLSGDEDLKSKAAGVEAKEDGEAITNDGLYFHNDYLFDQRVELMQGVERSKVFNNVELLNQEAKELLELLGDGVVDAVRDYVGLIAKAILDVADVQYVDLFHAARFIPREIAENEFKEDIEYSTLSPDEIKRRLKNEIKVPLLQILVRLPDETAKDFFKQIFGFEMPELKGE